jgi:hypothetical protein
MADDIKPADTNKDGKVTPKERRQYKKAQADTDAAKAADGGMTGDTLNKKELAAKYGYALRVLESDPELWQLFKRASNFKKGQWSKEEFTAQLMDTAWWRQNNESARKGLTAKALGGADWQAMLAEGKAAAQAEATRQGVTLNNDQLDSLAEDYVMKGWDQADRKQEMATAIAGNLQGAAEGEFMKGAAGSLQQQMMEIAEANGLKVSASFVESAARSVAMGLSTDDDWINQVREQSASVWGPQWQDKIMAGVDAKDLASGYINLMAQTFELNPDEIGLDDAYLRQAMTNVDANGNPAPLSLFDFQQKLREDPRFMKTKQAEDGVANVGNRILEMFGFAG